MMRCFAFTGLLVALAIQSAMAQLPSDAVILGNVKIPEKQKSLDLCPVTLTASDPKLPTWEYQGIEYRGAKPQCQAEFMKAPDKYAAAAAKQRWVNNFLSTMSIIWCPVTDEVNPGGGLQWEKLGYTWESCCRFCDEDVTDEDFPAALERLKQRAEKAYVASKGAYYNNAKSPVEGAIRVPGVTEFVGLWKLTLTTDNGRTIQRELKFTQEGEELKGTLSGQEAETPLAELDTKEDGAFSFDVSRKRGDESFTATYSGQLEKEKLSGTIEIQAGGQTHRLKFEGSRAKTPE
jgi:hypothetical protein